MYNGAFTRLRGGEAVDIVPPEIHPDRTHISNQYTLRVRPGKRWAGTGNPRDALKRFLQERGVASEVYYPVPLHRQECFAAFGPYPPLLVAEALAAEALSLPVFPELAPEEQAAVIEAVCAFAALA